MKIINVTDSLGEKKAWEKIFDKTYHFEVIGVPVRDKVTINKNFYSLSEWILTSYRTEESNPSKRVVDNNYLGIEIEDGVKYNTELSFAISGEYNMRANIIQESITSSSFVIETVFTFSRDSALVPNFEIYIH